MHAFIQSQRRHLRFSRFRSTAKSISTGDNHQYYSNSIIDPQGLRPQVKGWSKKVPGQDIFQLDKIFFPDQRGRHALGLLLRCMTFRLIQSLQLSIAYIIQITQDSHLNCHMELVHQVPPSDPIHRYSTSPQQEYFQPYNVFVFFFKLSF